MEYRPVEVGVIGCGNISRTYLQVMPRFPILHVVACADVVAERAEERASEFGLHAMTVEELLADPGIELVVNLTVPTAHAGVSLAALHAGKSVYSEKPLATNRDDGRRILELGREKGLRVGCAPDTFLGAGLQTCRRLIDEGAIGRPVAAVAVMAGHGPEGWHPNPEFFYQPGGGPLFDMGPYYLTALTSLLGPVRRVTGSATISFPERTITGKQRYGEKIKVNVPTHVAGVLDLAEGAVASLITSFDIWAAQLPRVEIYGSLGSLSCPDPNHFGGPVALRLAGETSWREVPAEGPYTENSRGLGVADMAYALRSGRPHRACGELAYHVLDVMEALQEASVLGRHIELESTCERPAPLPAGLPPWTLDG